MNYPKETIILDFTQTVQTLNGPMVVQLCGENSRIKTKCQFCNQSLLIHNLEKHQSYSQSCLKKQGQRQSCNGDGENNKITDETKAKDSQASSFPENSPANVNDIDDNDNIDNII